MFWGILSYPLCSFAKPQATRQQHFYGYWQTPHSRWALWASAQGPAIDRSPLVLVRSPTPISVFITGLSLISDKYNVTYIDYEERLRWGDESCYILTICLGPPLLKTVLVTDIYEQWWSLTITWPSCSVLPSLIKKSRWNRLSWFYEMRLDIAPCLLLSIIKNHFKIHFKICSYLLLSCFMQLLQLLIAFDGSIPLPAAVLPLYVLLDLQVTDAF